MSQTQIIDQNLKVALQAGKKNNIFIYHAPQASIKSNIPEKYEGPTQMLYAVCAELLSQGMKMPQWKALSRAIMLQAALDKSDGNKSKAAGLIGVSKIVDKAKTKLFIPDEIE